VSELCCISPLKPICMFQLPVYLMPVCWLCWYHGWGINMVSIRNAAFYAKLVYSYPHNNYEYCTSLYSVKLRTSHCVGWGSTVLTKYAFKDFFCNWICHCLLCIYNRVQLLYISFTVGFINFAMNSICQVTKSTAVWYMETRLVAAAAAAFMILLKYNCLLYC